MIRTVEELKLARDAYQAKVAMREGQTIAEGKIRKHVLICGGTGCTSSGSPALREALEKCLAEKGIADEIKIVTTGCFGL